MAKIKPFKWISEIWGKCNRGETVFRRFRKTIVVEANPSPSYTRTSKQAERRTYYKLALRKWYKLNDIKREKYRQLGLKHNLPAYQMFMKVMLLEPWRVLFDYVIVIDNSYNSSDLSDFQVLLEVKNDSSFFSTVKDKKYLEFYDTDMQTLLKHYVEEWDDINYNAKIWIKIPLIPASSIKKIYLKVNTKRTEDLSDPESVFDFFDDFLGDALDTSKWTPNYVNTVYYEVLNGELRIYDATKESNTYWIYDNSDTGSQIKANFAPLDKMIVEWKQKMEEQTVVENLGEVGLALVKSDNTIEVYNNEYDPTNDYIRYRIGSFAIINGSRNTSFIDILPDTYYIFRLIKNGNKYTHEVYDLEGNKIFEYSGESANAIDYMAIAVGAYGGNPFSPMRIDWVRVRKYAEPEPIVSYTETV